MPSLSLTKLKPIKLRTKINLLVLLNMALVLILLLSAISYIIVDRRFKETGARALVLARTVSSLPQIMEGLQTSQAVAIQPLADLIRKQSGAEFIVVADKNLIRYSHPNPEKIGKTLNADDLPLDQHVLEGREIQTTSTGSLGLSVRGKTPVLDAGGNPIGLVSVGFLVKDIWKDLLSLLLKMVLMQLCSLALSAHICYRDISKNKFSTWNQVKSLSSRSSRLQSWTLPVKELLL